MNVEDALKIIGVQNAADFEQIRSAYRELVKRWHPDRHDDPAEKLYAQTRLQKINEAFTFLETAFAYSGKTTSHQANDSPPDTNDSPPSGDDRPLHTASPASEVKDKKADPRFWAASLVVALLVLVALSSLGKALSNQRLSQVARQPHGSTVTTPSITGQWRTSQGDLVRLSESGAKVSIQLVSSPIMSNGSGNLTRSGTALKGTLRGRFRTSSSRLFTSPFNGVVISADRIEYTVDAVNLDAFGRERSRAKVRLYMTRN